MCFVLGSVHAPPRGPLGSLWWRLACCPQRLLASATAIGALLALALVWTEATRSTPVFALLPAIALPALSGLVLHLLPQWGDRTPLHYMRSLTLFNGFLLAILLLLHGHWQGVGLALYAVTLVFALTTLRDYLPWVRRQRQWHSRLAVGSLLLMSALSLALPLLSGA